MFTMRGADALAPPGYATDILQLTNEKRFYGMVIVSNKRRAIK